MHNTYSICAVSDRHKERRLISLNTLNWKHHLDYTTIFMT